MDRFSIKRLLVGWTESDGEESFGRGFYFAPLSGSVKRTGDTRLGRFIIAADDRIDRALSSTTARAYGLFLLSFGLLSLLLHFAKDYFNFYEEVPFGLLLIGSLFAILGIPFLLSDRPISVTFADFPLTDYLFFEFFCIKRTKGRAEHGIPSAVMLVLGLMLAVLGAVVPMEWVAFGIVAAVYLLLAVSSPEFSYFMIFLALPYLPILEHHELILAVMVGVTALSFFRKVTLGKRVLYVEQYDLVIFLFIGVILTVGVFVKGMSSFTSSLLMAALALGYPMAGGMITNRRVADRAISAIVLSSVPVSCYSVYQLIYSIATGGFSDFEGARAAFAKPQILATYLIITLVLSVYFVHARRSIRKRVLYSVVSVINLAALAATLQVWAFVACLVGLLAYAAARLRYASGAVSLLLGLLPYSLLFLPDGLISRLLVLPPLQWLGLEQTVSRARISAQIFSEHLLSGIGIGSDCFALEYAKYVDTGAVLSDSGNLLLQIGCEAGAIALALFLVIVLIRAVHRTVYRSYLKDSQVGMLSDFSSALLSALLAFGAFSYLWADLTTFYLFWCVFGIGSAALRVSKQEFDNLAAYMSDGAAADSSSIDIVIRG